MDNYTINSTADVYLHTNETFGLAFCQLVDFPSNGTDCSRSDPSFCINCSHIGRYFTGESIDDYKSIALIYYHVVWAIILIVATIAVFSNILILTIMKQRKTNRSFDILLLVLAGFDAFSSVMAIVGSTGSVAYFGNWFGRGQASMYWYLISLFIAIFGRTGSTYTTVLITIERYLMITIPFKAKLWFTPRATKIMAFLVLILAIVINYPRFVGYAAEPNDFRDIPSMENLEYVFRATKQWKFFYKTMKGVHNWIDYWLPLPIILVFNLLSFFKVRQLYKRRKELNITVKRDIRATRMFLPVVLVYFLTNIGPIVNYITIHFTKTIYRELVQILFVSIAVNSAVNFPIYYMTSATFRVEVQLLWSKLLGTVKLRNQMETETERDHQEMCGKNARITWLWRSDSGLPGSHNSQTSAT